MAVETYKVEYVTYDVANCRQVRKWEETVRCDLAASQGVETTTADLGNCSEARTWDAPGDGCCGAATPGFGAPVVQATPPTQGSVSGGSSDLIAEYTTYDLAKCEVISRACKPILPCGGATATPPLEYIIGSSCFGQDDFYFPDALLVGVGGTYRQLVTTYNQFTRVFMPLHRLMAVGGFSFPTPVTWQDYPPLVPGGERGRWHGRHGVNFDFDAGQPVNPSAPHFYFEAAVYLQGNYSPVFVPGCHTDWRVGGGFGATAQGWVTPTWGMRYTDVPATPITLHPDPIHVEYGFPLSPLRWVPSGGGYYYYSGIVGLTLWDYDLPPLISRDGCEVPATLTATVSGVNLSLYPVGAPAGSADGTYSLTWQHGCWSGTGTSSGGYPVQVNFSPGLGAVVVVDTAVSDTSRYYSPPFDFGRLSIEIGFAAGAASCSPYAASCVNPNDPSQTVLIEE